MPDVKVLTADGKEVETNDMNPWSLVAKFGVPSAIALYLVYMLTGNISTKISAIEIQMNEHKTQAYELIKQYEQVRIQSDRQLYTLQRICLNSAKDQVTRDACIAR